MKRKAIEIEGDEENVLPISKRRTPWVYEVISRRFFSYEAAAHYR